MTVEDVRNDENALTGLRQTSVGEDPDPEGGQRPDTWNPFTKSGSHVRELVLRTKRCLTPDGKNPGCCCTELLYPVDFYGANNFAGKGKGARGGENKVARST